MADEIELKGTTPDATVDTNAVLIGADTASSTAPALFQIADIWSHLRALSNTWSGTQTFSGDVAFEQTPTVNGAAVATSATAAVAGGAYHDGFSDFVANEHIDHSAVSIVAGNGLTGGGTIAASRTLNVGAGTGITVAADAISTNDSQIVHDNLSGYVANEHIDWTSATSNFATTGTLSAVDGAFAVDGDGAWFSLGDEDHWTRFSAGATTDYRCYLAWYEYTKTSHRWLMGRNAANTFVLYDASGASHRLEAPSGGNTYISGSGSGGVIVGQNIVDNGAGTGGFEVRDGSTSEALIFSAKTTGISAAYKVSIATSSAGQLVCERTGSDLNAHMEYKTVSGSIYAGKYGDTFRIGSSGDLSASNLFTITPSGRVGINAITAPSAELHVSGTIKHSTYTVGTLPSASTVGAGSRAAVTDANATTFNSVVAGGGANFVPVISDGSSWRIG